jgi:repressor LexA
MAVSLTRSQAEALRFIAGFQEANGYCPTFAEIGRGLNLVSKNHVARLLDGLEDRDAIRRFRGANSIEILQRPSLPRSPDGAPLRAVRIEGVA